MLTTVIAYSLIVVFFLAVERRRGNEIARTFQTGRHDGGSQKALAIGIVTVQLGLISGPVLNACGIGRPAFAGIAGWTGVALMTCGIALRYWAGKILGSAYTRTLQIQPDQRIIQQGPYGVIRHPGYAGALLMWIGSILATANAITFIAVTPVIFGAYVYRIQREEIMLLRAFGDRYRAYQRGTWKLIPFLF
jgi:protein-S-isoprenylcysteine O-methyltransferase